MPVKITTTDGYLTYSPVHIGPADDVLSERLDVSALGSDQVDDKGFIIPGAVLKLENQMLVPVDGTANEGQQARVVLYPVKVADSNAGADLNAANDVDVVSLLIGTLDRGIMEDNLNRALSANEVTALNESRMVLTDPVS